MCYSIEKLRSKPRRRGVALWGVAGLLGLIVSGGAVWWRANRVNPSACPYRWRLFLALPRPFVTRARLREVLAPEPGERVLEVGVGTGYYALHTARWLEPGGTLEILDAQPEMLDHATLRAREFGVSNVLPTLGDARALPYPDGSFDAVYLVATLGEVSDKKDALRELARALAPGGSLMVGEAFPDPHMVPFADLGSLAETAGLRFERRVGGKLGYLARFRAPDPAEHGDSPCR